MTLIRRYSDIAYINCTYLSAMVRVSQHLLHVATSTCRAFTSVGRDVRRRHEKNVPGKNHLRVSTFVQLHTSRTRWHPHLCGDKTAQHHDHGPLPTPSKRPVAVPGRAESHAVRPPASRECPPCTPPPAHFCYLLNQQTLNTTCMTSGRN